MRNLMALIVVSTLVSACDNGSPTAPDQGSLLFTTVSKETTSGFFTPQREILASESEWREAWQTIYAGQSPAPPVPPIDFGREMVILAASGSRPDGCYTLDITDIHHSIEGVEIVVTETVPGPACVCVQIVTQPVHAVRIERIPGTVYFTGTSQRLDC